MTRSVRYQPILHTLYYTLHTEHAYCLSYRFFNNVVITTVIETVEMVEILDERLGKRSVERVRYVINNLLHLVIVKYGDISLVLCISTPCGSWQYCRYSWNISSYSTLTRVISHIKSYFTSKSGIWLVISRVASYFHEPEASANTAYEWNNRAIFHDECNKWFILYACQIWQKNN